MKKIVLVDGNNLVYRSYYATAYTGNTMKNSKGFPTNAIYGYINMLNKIINEEKPEFIMVAFDKGKTFRHDQFEAYKDGRIETPEDLKKQMPIAKQITEAMGIKYMEIDNYEADDIIGTYSEKLNYDDHKITIISSDKDLLQLINDNVEVKLLKQSGFIRMDRETFINEYGVEPIKMIDLKALMGDPADNIPGVKGIGEKTAISLIKEFGSLKELYEKLDEVKGKTKEKLENDKDNAFMSYSIATIYNDVPINTSLNEISYEGINTLKYLEILEELEFYSLIKKIDIDESLMKENIKVKLDYEIVSDIKDFIINDSYALYLEILGDNYHKDQKIGFSVYNKENAYFIPYEVFLNNPEIFNDKYEKYTYDLKKILVTAKYNNIKVSNCNFDLMLAAYLLNYNIGDDIATLANNLDEKIEFYENIYGKGVKLALPEESIYQDEIVNKAKFIYESKDIFLKQIKEIDNEYLFNKIEMPLVEVLADMEYTGIRVDKEFLSKMGIELTDKIDRISKEIYDLANEEFNISSPKQLGIVLFEKLAIPYPKKIKDNSYSTSKDILDKLSSRYAIIDKILEYRTLTKLKSNYVEGLLNEVQEDNKIHTIFNQTLTRTGRLSSTSPNLQNIPIRLEYGRLIRKAFVPEEDSFILSSDYSQIELRVFAHMSKAENLIQAFKEGKDIHTKTAADIFQIDEQSVTKDMRRTAKAVNFGILYGISSFGLSEDLGIDIQSAKSFIDVYLQTYPGIKEYMDKVILNAKEKGYVTTLMNRKRIIDEINNKNYMISQQGERMALNTPVQGTSADILKKAMIEIYQEFKDKNLESKMIIQVHDELVFNVKNDEANLVKDIVERVMENTYQLDVPLKVDIEFGKDWYQAK
ncbi:MAG: DNA polymerase I [Bacilli bacterium]|nr:DNA polymerase I [Bacilli bacterium]